MQNGGGGLKEFLQNAEQAVFSVLKRALSLCQHDINEQKDLLIIYILTTDMALQVVSGKEIQW